MGVRVGASRRALPSRGDCSPQAWSPSGTDLHTEGSLANWSGVSLRATPIWIGLGMACFVTCLLGSWYLPAPAEAAKKRILHFASKEPETLDPHTSVLGQVQAIVLFVYRGLTRFAIQDGKVTTTEVEPDLAESWTTSDDGTVWTFKLRKGVQFHKGFGEMTAEDVQFSFERQIKRTKGMLFAQNLEVIKEITVVDPYTVQCTLKAYDPIFLLRMVGYQHGDIVSKKAAERFGDQFGWNPVGTGPFSFDKHLPRSNSRRSINPSNRVTLPTGFS